MKSFVLFMTLSLALVMSISGNLYQSALLNRAYEAGQATELDSPVVESDALSLLPLGEVMLMRGNDNLGLFKLYSEQLNPYGYMVCSKFHYALGSASFVTNAAGINVAWAK